MIDIPAAAAAAGSLAITAAAGIGFGIGGHARRLVAVGAKGGGSNRVVWRRFGLRAPRGAGGVEVDHLRHLHLRAGRVGWGCGESQERRRGGREAAAGRAGRLGLRGSGRATASGLAEGRGVAGNERAGSRGEVASG